MVYSSAWQRPGTRWNHPTMLQNNRRQGFTLLELVVVTLLTAILMTALVGVLRSVIRESRANDNELMPSEQLNALLRRDLTNAIYYRWRANQLELRGPLSVNPATGESVMTSAEVSYQIGSTSLGGLLLRQQILQTEGIARQAARASDPIWLGVKAIDFETSFLDIQDAVDESGAVVGDGWKQLPPTFTLRIFGSSNQLIISESIVGAG